MPPDAGRGSPARQFPDRKYPNGIALRPTRLQNPDPMPPRLLAIATQLLQSIFRKARIVELLHR